MNDRFIRALRRQPVDRTPVWIMRQAGRYLPEYNVIRAEAPDFVQLCKTPELACAITLLPLQRFAFDAAIVFSDILMIPEAMGFELQFIADVGPCFGKVISSAVDVRNLRDLDPEQDLAYVSQAIRMITSELDNTVPLIGFAGSPWTVATYMVEGQSSKQFSKIKGLMYQAPEVLHKLLAHLSKQISNALLAQINAGAQVVMLFDTWGGILTDQLFAEFSLRYMAEIVATIASKFPQVPCILFTKNGGRCLVELAATGCAALGLDWNADLRVARSLVGSQVALQGNMDPAVLYASPERITAEVRSVLNQYGTGTGHIFNLGHGILPNVPVENVQVMLDAVHQYSVKFQQTTAMV